MARWELVERYAKAQAAFDELETKTGLAKLSWKDVWRVKSLRVGNRPLHQIPDWELQGILDECLRIYKEHIEKTQKGKSNE